MEVGRPGFWTMGRVVALFGPVKGWFLRGWAVGMSKVSESGIVHKLRLVAFDMEGTLTCDPTVWELMHRRLGTWESHGLPYWERDAAG